MRRAAPVLGLLLLLGAAGCGNPPPPAPDEIALGRYQEANRLFAEGRWAEAAAEYEAVVRARDRIRDAWWRLADCQEKLGDRAAAAGTLRRWLKVDPTDQEARRRLEALSS